MKSNFYNPIFKTIYLLFCVLNAMNLKAQWISKVPQTADTLWLFHNQVIDPNTVWMGGNQYMFDTSMSPVSGSFVSIYSTIDGGANWRYKKLNIDTSNGNTPFLTSVNGANGMSAYVGIYMLGDGTNLILKTVDGGNTWTPTATNVFTSSESFVDGIAFKDAKNGVMMGDPIPDMDTIYHFEIYNTSDSGKTWTRIADSKIPDPLEEEYGIAGEISRVGDRIWFPTDHGRIFYSKDGGQNWQFSIAGTGYTSYLNFVDSLHGICASADTFISSKGSLEIKYTENGGLTWQYVKSPFKDSTYFWSMCLIPQSNYILCNNAATLQGAPFTTLLSKDKGITWTVIGTGIGLAAAEFITPAVGYAGDGISLGQNHGTQVHKYIGNPLNGLLTDFEIKAQLSFYPNPATDKIMMDINMYKVVPILILVNSLDGKLVWDKKSSNVSNYYHEEIDLKSLAPGAYVVTISSPEGHVSKTFIKQ